MAFICRQGADCWFHSRNPAMAFRSRKLKGSQAALDRTEEKDVLLNIGSQVEQVLDLADAGPADVAMFGQSDVIGELVPGRLVRRHRRDRFGGVDGQPGAGEFRSMSSGACWGTKYAGASSATRATGLVARANRGRRRSAAGPAGGKDLDRARPWGGTRFPPGCRGRGRAGS
jgi:hypothetical protein